MALRLYLVLLPLLLASGLTAEVSSYDWKARPPIDVKVGDLVFRRGQGLWTRYFINISTREKRFSHVGVVVSNSTDVVIAHAEAGDLSGVGSVYLQEWKGFCRDSLELAVFRYDGQTSERESIADEAMKMLGVPFDPYFDMRETNKLYCTEFIRIAVNNGLHTNLVGWTETKVAPVIAIDDVYRNSFTRVFDSGSADKKD